MVKEVIHDPIFLGVKSEKATKEDSQVVQYLLDTLIANKDSCVGMVANMIGVRKRIIVFDNEGTYMTMFNPEIIKKSGPYDIEEGCLVGYNRTFTDWTAQIIQHEADYCN